MAARSISSGTISFGLVSIPVKLFSTAQSGSGLSFHLMHKACGSRVKQQYICAKEQVIVERVDMVKGYEFAKDQYVLFTPEELEALEAQATETIDITEFVPADQVDPVFFDKAYYLGPDKGADRAYRLLTEALKQSGRAAIAKYAARGKQYLVMLRPRGEALVMQQLHYASEVRPVDEVPLGEATLKEAELKLAEQVIAQGANDAFEPEKYKDDVRERIDAQIERKVQGEAITVAAAPGAKQGQIIDLMEALKASLSRGEADGAERKPPKRASEKSAEPKAKRQRGK
ncbi:MAG: Ku protein [Myxococcaceae bacterium]